MNYSKNLVRFLPFLLLPLIYFGIDYFTGRKTVGYPVYIIVTVVLVLISIFFLIKSIQQRNILRDGIPGTAKVLAVEDTGIQVNYRPQLKIKLLVAPHGKISYETTHTESVDYFNITKLQIGSEINVVVDKNKPNKLLIKW